MVEQKSDYNLGPLHFYSIYFSSIKANIGALPPAHFCRGAPPARPPTQYIRLFSFFPPRPPFREGLNPSNVYLTYRVNHGDYIGGGFVGRSTSEENSGGKASMLALVEEPASPLTGKR